MGRKKIIIKPIKDERNRHVTFNKRKSGLIKKAMELSILCNCQISLVVFNAEGQLFEYCSTDPRFILQRYCTVAHLPHERLTNNDYAKYEEKTKGKGKKKGNSEDGDDDDDSNDGMPTNIGQSNVQGINPAMIGAAPGFPMMANLNNLSTLANMTNVANLNNMGNMMNIARTNSVFQPQSSLMQAPQPMQAQAPSPPNKPPAQPSSSSVVPDLNMPLTPSTIDVMSRSLERATPSLNALRSQLPGASAPPQNNQVTQSPVKMEKPNGGGQNAQNKRKIEVDDAANSPKRRKTLSIEVPGGAGQVLTPAGGQHTEEEVHPAQPSTQTAEMHQTTSEDVQTTEHTDNANNYTNTPTTLGQIYNFPQNSPTTPFLTTPNSLSNMVEGWVQSPKVNSNMNMNT